MKSNQDKPRYKNVMRCGICGAPADRVGGPPEVSGFDWPDYYFECQKNPCHMADPFVGIFYDLTPPEKVIGENL